ncbi:queuosine salvage protein [Drosophila eugracilis]|uniref:queuosine salvage protein n=1 Tax=Drosophila eugracilis TaxID=29029 RepID=UPI0007E64F37|nr:queuosine salvage protein [Drosophila eugracilis]
MSNAKLNPRQSGAFIVEHAQHVRIIPAGIEKLTQEIVKGLKEKRIAVENFSQHELHPNPNTNQDDYSKAADWVFVLDTLNFCFWTPNNYTKYKVDGYTGYFALCAAIKRAIKEGLDVINPKFYSDIDLKTLKSIFRSDDGDTEIPLIEKRLEALHEVGKVVIEKYDGKFENIIKKAEKSAVSLLNLIVEEFPCFRDEAEFAGKRVSILKRAQILVADVWSCYRGQGLGYFKDIEQITMFADYRVPQVLVHFGSLEYSHELMEFLKSDTILENGDPREVEIRGASIYIIEQVRDAVIKVLQEQHPEISLDNVNSIVIDQYLWDYRRQHNADLEHIPFHKVVSIYY